MRNGIGLKRAFKKLPLVLAPVALAFVGWFARRGEDSLFVWLLLVYGFFFGFFVLIVIVSLITECFPEVIKSIKHYFRKQERRMGLKRAFEKLPLVLSLMAFAFGFWIEFKNGFFDGLIVGFSFFVGVWILVFIMVWIGFVFPKAIKKVKSIREDLNNPQRRKRTVVRIIINSVEGVFLFPAIILLYASLGGFVSFGYSYLSFCLFILAISVEVWSMRDKKRKRQGNEARKS